MRKQDHLLQLIGTLSPAEKRYFKQFNSIQTGDKRYMSLYDALQNEPQYHAVELMKKLNINSKELRNDKYYLGQSLLKCLRNFEQPDTDIPVNRQVEISRNEVGILLSRGLYSYALEVTEKTLELALEYEMFDMSANLMAVRYICLHNTEQFDKLTDAFFDERERLAGITAEYRALHRILFMASQAERKRSTPARLDKLVMQTVIKQNPAKLQSLVAQEAWFDIMIKYYAITGNSLKALELARLQWAIYSRHKSIKKVAPFIWLKSYLYLMEMELEAGKAKNALQMLDDLEKTIYNSSKPVFSQSSILRRKEHLYCIRITILCRLNRFKEVIKRVESHDPNISQTPVYEQFLVLFYYSVALLHENQCDKAIVKLNELLQLNAEEREDLQPYIRPAIILCHLRQGNFQTVPYLIKSSKAWMKRQKIASAEIELFFSIAYNIAKAPAWQRSAGWTKLKDAIAADKLPGLNKEFHLELWLQQNNNLSKAVH